MQNFYLCTGFHRSGTSLVANGMADNGVNMGSELMGPSFANPKGHFEDIPLVNLHDAILTSNATDWRYCDSAQLKVTPYFYAQMESYVEARKQQAEKQELIGAKDPRAIFFLEQWHRAAKGQLKVLMVYRDWRFSVSSLLKRHSRELLQFTMPITSRTVDYTFWEDPTLAARMWLASANAMIAWYSKHPNDTLLFSQKAYIEAQSDLLRAAEEKGIEPSILQPDAFHKGYMQTTVPESLLGMIPDSIQQACNEAQHKLNNLAIYVHEEPVSVEPVSPLITLIFKRLETREGMRSEKNPDSFRVNTASLSNEALIETLKALPANPDTVIDWEGILNRDQFKPSEYDELYLVAVKFQQWSVAEIALHRALSKSVYHYRYTHLGDIYFRRKMFLKAREYYEKAEALVTDNPTTLARLSEVAVQLDEEDLAQSMLAKAASLDPDRPAVRQAEHRLNQYRKRLADSRKQGQLPKTDNMLVINRYEDVVRAFKKGSQFGNAIDEHMVKTSFVMRDNLTWLRAGTDHLAAPQQLCLINYLVGHLQRHWPDEVIQTELVNCADVNMLPPLPISSPSSEPTLGVCLHVFHQHLLPEIFSLLQNMPHITKLVLTCPQHLYDWLYRACEGYAFAEVVAVTNQGRDIYPWLQTSGYLANCDLVLKLHTKATPHEPALKGWRLQLLWQLLGSKSQVENIISQFKSSPNLGMVIPNYHPKLADAINWGDNHPLAVELGRKLGFSVPDSINLFPAGSMFWYRPAALQPLLKANWSSDDFPVENGQIDGTLMHAIERALCLLAEQQGFKILRVPQPSID